jgi:hypothetical protein
MVYGVIVSGSIPGSSTFDQQKHERFSVRPLPVHITGCYYRDMSFPYDYDDVLNEEAEAEVWAYERDRAAGKTVEPADPFYAEPPPQ